ncbi:MAG: hypothetical protein BGO90_10400 [Legionella sp. 40-6]|nr:MAG: hypothetical protein BGO90_10400 [Legionella sp. 40-6]
MRDKRADRIKSLIRTMVDQLEFDKSGVRISTNIYKISEEIIEVLENKNGNQKTNQSRIDFLSQDDACIILIKFTQEACKNIISNDNRELVTGLLEPSVIESLCNDIFDFLLSLPRCYNIQFQIPLFHGDKLFKFNHITMGFSFDEPLPKVPNIPLIMAKNNNSIGLNCRVEGYCNNENNDTYKSALSLLKVIIQQGLTEKIFIKKEEEKYSSYLYQALSIHKGKTIPEYFVQVTEVDADGEVMCFSLPDHIAHFISQLTINYYYLTSLPDHEEFLNKFFQRCCRIAFEKNLENIKAACEWLFNSHAYETNDISMSFLQICFGLESLFTENKERGKENDPPILALIATKIAYLIANDAKERKSIMDKIKKFYGIRSGLVHGRKTSLRAKERDLFYFGKIVLGRSIQKEIKMTS